MMIDWIKILDGDGDVAGYERARKIKALTVRSSGASTCYVRALIRGSWHRLSIDYDNWDDAVAFMDHVVTTISPTGKSEPTPYLPPA